MKYLILVIALFLIPSSVKADAYMQEYKNKNLRKTEVYKGESADLKEQQMKEDFESNPLEDRPAPIQAQEIPKAAPETVQKPQMPQLPPNMSLQDASALGRKLLEQQKAQQRK